MQKNSNYNTAWVFLLTLLRELPEKDYTEKSLICLYITCQLHARISLSKSSRADNFWEEKVFVIPSPPMNTVRTRVMKDGWKAGRVGIDGRRFSRLGTSDFITA